MLDGASSLVKSCKKNIESCRTRKTLKHSHTTRRTLQFHTCSDIALNLFYGGDTTGLVPRNRRIRSTFFLGTFSSSWASQNVKYLKYSISSPSHLAMNFHLIVLQKFFLVWAKTHCSVSVLLHQKLEIINWFEVKQTNKKTGNITRGTNGRMERHSKPRSVSRFPYFMTEFRPRDPSHHASILHEGIQKYISRMMTWRVLNSVYELEMFELLSVWTSQGFVLLGFCDWAGWIWMTNKRLGKNWDEKPSCWLRLNLWTDHLAKPCSCPDPGVVPATY